MNQRVAAVESKGQDAANYRSTEPGNSRAWGNSDARFTYPGGSRPLEGFTIKRGIGHGGFGEVYFATSDAGKEVALKLIRRNFDVELRGIRHCLNLKHPNLLSVFDIREDERGDRWVVMEHVAGDSLEDVIDAHPGGMSLEQVVAWFHGIGAGVACLHDHGIVHRDLKPANIFCDEGVVKIGDYGLAKFISCSRRSGQTESVGTVHYMAPEVANGRYGKEIDVYALGIVLYEMLTGRVPFEGESVGEVLMKHLTARPDVSALSEPFRSVVARALEKDPARRFRSVGEMLACLPQPRTARVAAGAWTASAATARDAAADAAPAGAGASDEEPILRAVRGFVGRLRRSWRESNLDPATRTALTVVAVIALALSSGGWLPVAITLAMIYVCYWIVRSLVLSLSPARRHEPREAPSDGSPLEQTWPHPSGPPPGPATGPDARPPGGAAGRHGRLRHRAMPRWARRAPAAQAIILGSPRERFAELLGSMIGGALTAITMCVVLVMLNSFRTGLLAEPQVWAWLMLAGVVGTWTVVIPAKLWEYEAGESLVRRFVLMVLGMGMGALAGAAAWLLKVRLPYDPGFSEAHRYVVPGFYADGTPLVMAYMACFGTLLFAIRWWKLADPLRPTRLSLTSVVWCVVVAWLVCYVWQFPQPWLMIVACAMSVSIQLAGKWLPARHRRHEE